MPPAKKPRAPSNLGSKAAAFWRGAVGTYTFRLDELLTLEQACREIDVIEKMESIVSESKSLMVSGSMKQKVAHPLLVEIRQHRALLTQQLKALGMVDPGAAAGERSSQARAAANARWSRGAAAS